MGNAGWAMSDDFEEMGDVDVATRLLMAIAERSRSVVVRSQARVWRETLPVAPCTVSEFHAASDD